MENPWLQNMYSELGKVRSHFSPEGAGKSENWELVKEIGGTKNDVGEKTGTTETRTPFFAVEHTPTTEENMRAGAGDSMGELKLHVEDDLLTLGDRVERASDGTPFRVVAVDDAGGSSWDMGDIVTLEELND